MKTLVWVEHDGQAVKDATLSAVTAASQLGEVHLLVVGQGVDGVAAEAAKIAGVGKVHVADDAAFAHALAENVAPLIVELMGTHDAFVAPSTTHGKNIAPRVAALLDVMQISDILSVESEDTFTRPIYAGNAIATVQSSDAKKVITVRGTAFAYSFAVNSGTILNRSPTRPMSATWKIGASSSLLIAMMTFESFIPARCWIAPEMPTATYTTGATIFPVWPTW